MRRLCMTSLWPLKFNKRVVHSREELIYETTTELGLAPMGELLTRTVEQGWDRTRFA